MILGERGAFSKATPSRSRKTLLMTYLIEGIVAFIALAVAIVPVGVLLARQNADERQVVGAAPRGAVRQPA